MTKLKSILWLLPVVAGFQAAAQSWDTGGNSLLNGTYYFRQVIWVVGDEYGDIGDAVAVYGTLNFNGSGQYTVSNVQVNDYQNSAICTVSQSSNSCDYPTSGTYSISSSGYGFVSSLIVPATSTTTGDQVYGLVSNGIFIASSTENTTCQNNSNSPCYNDIFIAVPANGSLTNSAFQGTYMMADLDPSVNLEVYNSGGQGTLYTRASTFQMTPNGSGNVPGFTATGYIAGNGTTQTTQSVPSASYSFSSGAAVYNLAGSITSGNANTVLIAGQKYFYLSPDGNFVVGGSPTGWDMIVGVRTSTSNNNFSGLYYQNGVLVDDSQLGSSGAADIQSYYGAYNVFCTGSCQGNNIVGHQRIDDALEGDGYAFDYTYADTVTSSSGVYSDSSNQYSFTDNGAIGIGSPTIFTSGAQLGLTVLVQSSSFSPSGSVYISPTGIVNAGSSAPFTAQFAPGELVSIYGTNLASTTATDLTLPTTLGGTEVLVNGSQTQMSYVSPTQINAVIPIGITTPIASIQVMNGSGTSNTVTNFVGETQPGIFNSLPPPVPAVQHADYSMVTSSSPIVPGETILVYLTGLGTLSGENATNSFTAYFEDPVNGNLTASVAFAGSQSSVGGGYQMNITVPTTVTSGNLEYLDISGPDSYNSEAVVPIGSASTASLRKQNRVPHRSKQLRPRPRFQRDSGSTASHLHLRRNSAAQ
jgi:uncharacterized protein (TIGR03437 family)